MPTQETMPKAKEALFRQGDTAPVVSWTLSTNLYSAYIVAKAGKQLILLIKTAVEIAVQYSKEYSLMHFRIQLLYAGWCTENIGKNAFSRVAMMVVALITCDLALSFISAVLLVVLYYSKLNSSCVTDEKKICFRFQQKEKWDPNECYAIVTKEKYTRDIPTAFLSHVKPSRLTTNCAISHRLWHTDSLTVRSFLKLLWWGICTFWNMSWKSNQIKQKSNDWLVVIPANAVIVDMNPNTQLSGGVAPVSLIRDIHGNNKKSTFKCVKKFRNI